MHGNSEGNLVSIEYPVNLFTCLESIWQRSYGYQALGRVSCSCAYILFRVLHKGCDMYSAYAYARVHCLIIELM
jgi:hypothetical protein